MWWAAGEEELLCLWDGQEFGAEPRCGHSVCPQRLIDPASLGTVCPFKDLLRLSQADTAGEDLYG
jgi:hypothetical protein